MIVCDYASCSEPLPSASCCKEEKCEDAKSARTRGLKRSNDGEKEAIVVRLLYRCQLKTHHRDTDVLDNLGEREAVLGGVGLDGVTLGIQTRVRPERQPRVAGQFGDPA